MLDYYTALEEILNSVHTLTDSIHVPLLNTHNYILAEEIIANYDTPLFDNSAMDGYAINNINQTEWQVTDTIYAGDNKLDLMIPSNSAVRIFTGGAIPQNTDAVIMQEKVIVDGSIIKLKESELINLNSNIRFKGEELKAGKIIFNKNTKITPSVQALAASQGYEKLLCYRKLKVMVFSNGNELINFNEKIQPCKIFDSNRIMFLSWLKDLGYDVTDGGILADDEQVISQKFSQSVEHFDVIICSAGVSVGDKDYIKKILAKLGQVNQYKLLIKPGKPFTWGQIANTKFFLLPGNPVSSFVTFNQLVVPALKKLSGYTIPLKYSFAKALFSRTQNSNRREFLRGKTEIIDLELCVNFDHKRQGSSMLSACAVADVLIEIEPNSQTNPGDRVKIWPINC